MMRSNRKKVKYENSFRSYLSSSKISLCRDGSSYELGINNSSMGIEKPDILYSNRDNIINRGVKTEEIRSIFKDLESDISIINKEENEKKTTRMQRNMLFGIHKCKVSEVQSGASFVPFRSYNENMNDHKKSSSELGQSNWQMQRYKKVMLRSRATLSRQNCIPDKTNIFIKSPTMNENIPRSQSKSHNYRWRSSPNLCVSSQTNTIPNSMKNKSLNNISNSKEGVNYVIESIKEKSKLSNFGLEKTRTALMKIDSNSPIQNNQLNITHHTNNILSTDMFCSENVVAVDKLKHKMINPMIQYVRNFSNKKSLLQKSVYKMHEPAKSLCEKGNLLQTTSSLPRADNDIFKLNAHKIMVTKRSTTTKMDDFAKFSSVKCNFQLTTSILSGAYETNKQDEHKKMIDKICGKSSGIYFSVDREIKENNVENISNRKIRNDSENKITQFTVSENLGNNLKIKYPIHSISNGSVRKETSCKISMKDLETPYGSYSIKNYDNFRAEVPIYKCLERNEKNTRFELMTSNDKKDFREKRNFYSRTLEKGKKLRNFFIKESESVPEKKSLYHVQDLGRLNLTTNSYQDKYNDNYIIHKCMNKKSSLLCIRAHTKALEKKRDVIQNLMNGNEAQLEDNALETSKNNFSLLNNTSKSNLMSFPTFTTQLKPLICTHHKHLSSHVQPSSLEYDDRRSNNKMISTNHMTDLKKRPFVKIQSVQIKNEILNERKNNSRYTNFSTTSSKQHLYLETLIKNSTDENDNIEVLNSRNDNKSSKINEQSFSNKKMDSSQESSTSHYTNRRRSISWLSALREKQRRRKDVVKISSEYCTIDNERLMNSAQLEGNDAISVNVDVITSLFGKRIPHIHTKGAIPKLQQSFSSNQSPWPVKLKPIPKDPEKNQDPYTKEQLLKKSMFPSKKNVIKDFSHAYNQPLNNDCEYSFLNEIFVCKTIMNLAVGDSINLDDLSLKVSRSQGKLYIVPLKDTKERNDQMVVMSDLLLFTGFRHSLKLRNNDKNYENLKVSWCSQRSEIKSLTLDIEAACSSITMKDGGNISLSFKRTQDCLCFAQLFYGIDTKCVNSRGQKNTNIVKPYCAVYEDVAPSYEVKDILKVHHMQSIDRNNYFPDSSKMNTQKNILNTHQLALSRFPTKDSDNSFTGSPSHDSLRVDDMCLSTIFSDHEHIKINNLQEQENKEMIFPPHTYSVNKKMDLVACVSRRENNSLHFTETEKEELIFNKYCKMLNFNVPKEAVRHKMLQENVGKKVMNRVVQVTPKGDQIDVHFDDDASYQSKNKIATSFCIDLDYQKCTIESKSVFEEKDAAIVCKYHNILKYLLPIEAVRQKIQLEEVDRNIVDTFLDDVLSTCVSCSRVSPSLTENVREFTIKSSENITNTGCKCTSMSNNINKKKLDKKESDILLHETKEEYYCDTTDKEQEIVSRYRKMLSIGIPQEAVQHKMAKDKVSNKIFKLVLSLSNESSDKNDTKLVDSLTPEEDIVAHKYRKMLKMNVPQEAIRQRMIMNNVDHKIISNILNVDIEGSISKFDKIKKMKKSQLISLHWTPLSEEELKNSHSVWNKSVMKRKKNILQPVGNDISILEKMFRRKRKKSMDHIIHDRVETYHYKKGKANLIDRSRAQNISISLKAFKNISSEELVYIINNLDPERRIQGECIQFLSNLLPTPVETLAVKNYKGDDSSLVPAEIFFRQLQAVDRVAEKIKTLQFIESFHQSVLELTTNLNLLCNVCNQVMNSEKLLLILEAVLAVGNIMNEGTRTGGAAGFKFDSLLKLSLTKSIDGKMTVLDYIVLTFIAKYDRSLLDLSSEFPDCKIASRILITDIVTDISALRNGMKECYDEFTKIKFFERIESPTSSIGSDVKNFNHKNALMASILSRNKCIIKENEFQRDEKLGTVTIKNEDNISGLKRVDFFLENSKREMKKLEKIKDDAIKTCRELAVYCGETDGENSATNLLCILAEFMKNLRSATEKHDKLKNLKTENQRKGKHKVNN